MTLAKTIELGHKAARHALAKDEKMLRFDACFGPVNEAVACGEHLHTHDLESDYPPTYTHEAGHEFVPHQS